MGITTSVAVGADDAPLLTMFCVWGWVPQPARLTFFKLLTGGRHSIPFRFVPFRHGEPQLNLFLRMLYSGPRLISFTDAESTG